MRTREKEQIRVDSSQKNKVVKKFYNLNHFLYLFFVINEGSKPRVFNLNNSRAHSRGKKCMIGSDNGLSLPTASHGLRHTRTKGPDSLPSKQRNSGAPDFERISNKETVSCGWKEWKEREEGKEGKGRNGTKERNVSIV